MLPARTISGILLALVLLPARGAAAAPDLPRQAPQMEWYQGNRFLWQCIFTGDEYAAGARQLKAAQFAAWRGRSRFNTVPLDMRFGKDSPRVSHISVAPELGEAARFPGLRPQDLEQLKPAASFPGLLHLDLDGVDEPLDTRPLLNCQVTMLTLPRAKLRDAHIEDLFPPTGTLPRLRHLDVQVLPGAALTPEVVLQRLAKREVPLESLQLSWQGVTDKWMELLPQLTDLKALRLYKTLVTPQGLQHLAELKHLTHLSLEGNVVGPKAISVLAQCTRLEELQLMEKEVDDAVMAALPQLTTVRRLAMEDIAVTPGAIKHLSKMPALRIVVLSSKGEVVVAAQEWQQEDPLRRRIYKNPDLYFGGWIEGVLSDIFWAYPRELDPLHYP